MPENSKPSISSQIPSTGRLLGFDFGTVRVGIALCDPEQKFSSPLEVYHRRSKTKDSLFFKQLALQERAVGLVVGLPLHTSGKESEKSREARLFAGWIAELTSLPVRLYDERFTTAMAREMLSMSKMSGKKRKEKLDKIAAHILLSTYLECSDKSVGLSDFQEDALDDQES